MSLYPHRAECDTCGGGIKSGVSWVCGDCLTIAAELGIHLTGQHKPTEDEWRLIRNEIYRRQRAETEKRSHASGQAHSEGSP